MVDLSPRELSLPASPCRVAVLVDGDNVPFAQMAQLEAFAERKGEIVIRQVFGDFSRNPGWANDTCYFHIHCTTTAGKNRADMYLILAAMELAYRNQAAHFIVVSDDADFEPLIAHLRLNGFGAERIGKVKPPPVLENMAKEASAAKVKSAPKPLGSLSKTDMEIRDAILAAGETKRVAVQRLGSLMGQKRISAKSTGSANWSKYLAKHSNLYRLEGQANARTVLWLGSTPAPHTAP